MVSAMTRIVVIDPQPAVRAGLGMMLRTEPGLVPVGAAVGGRDGLKLVSRQRPDVVVLDGVGSGHVPEAALARPSAARRALRRRRRSVAAGRARVAGADGLVAKEAPAEELYEAIRLVARGGTALPRAGPRAARRRRPPREPEDLALLAMLVDRTEPAEVAATLRLDRRRMARRIERLLARLRERRARPRPA